MTILSVALLLAMSVLNYFLCQLMVAVRSRLTSKSVNNLKAAGFFKIVVQFVWLFVVLINYRFMLSVGDLPAEFGHPNAEVIDGILILVFWGAPIAIFVWLHRIRG